ncbi:hypothetical protein ACTXG6_06080 [Pseudonocardia sp. Cha107L01]|uniref:hypothetical protein n=1 Tax=Pseudonocardia sp. Cha107L01 TaxID=3457576 RepID=UPI00403EC2F5
MNHDEMRILGDRMDELDIELFEAQKAGNTSAQIVALRERAHAWREWGQLLDKAGRESHGAELAAQRDEITAAELAGGAL